MGTIVLVVLAVLAWLWLKRWMKVQKAARHARAQMKAAGIAKKRETAERNIQQRLHTFLPESALIRIFRWTPERKIRSTVRIARYGFRGNFLRISPAQHIMVVGLTGSGKSSTLRVLAAWALQAPGWHVEAWDGKWGASVRAYRGKGPVLDEMDAIEARLADLVARELPLRAKMAEPPHLAIVMDESRLLNELSATGMRDLVTVIQTGRELGVHLWFGLQDPKTDSVPSEIRDQFTCKIVHQLQTREAAQVALKELVTAGWEPQRLMRSGQMIVWTPVLARRTARVVFGLWLSPSVLAGITPVGPLTAPECTRPVDLTKASVRPAEPAHYAGARRRSVGRTDALTRRQEYALRYLRTSGPCGAADLARRMNVQRNRAHEVLTQLAGKGLVKGSEDGIYTATEA